MSYHTAPASGWELSLVSGFKLERSGKTHSYRIPLLASLQIILHPFWPLSLPETPDQVRTFQRGECEVTTVQGKQKREVETSPSWKLLFQFCPPPLLEAREAEYLLRDH